MPQVKQSETHKICPKCDRWLDRIIFGCRSNGHTQAYCPDCRVEYRKENKKPQLSKKDEWDTSKPGKGKAEGRPCPVCEEIFYPHKANLKRGLGKFCSPKCAHKKQVKPALRRICQQCGEAFNANKGEAKRGGAKFCKPQCWYEYNTGENNPLWQEHYTSYRGRDWREIRELILFRDEYKCVHCGKSNEQEESELNRSLSIHHKDPYRHTQNNSMDNLESVCAACHMKLEWEIRKREMGK